MKNAHLKIYLNISPNNVKIDNYAFISMLFKNKQQKTKKNRILILFRKNVSYQIFGNRTNFWDKDPLKKNFPLFSINLIIINLNLTFFSQKKLKQLFLGSKYHYFSLNIILILFIPVYYYIFLFLNNKRHYSTQKGLREYVSLLT